MPLLVLLEPLTEHFLLCPLTALALHYVFAVPLYIFVPVNLIAWCVADYLLMWVLEVGTFSMTIVAGFQTLP